MLVRRHWLYLVLACWSALWFAILAPRGGIDWKFFTTGASLLFGGHPAVITGITGGPGTAGPAGLPGAPPPGGLHIFANYPALQMGPLAYLVTGVVRYLAPHHGLAAAEVMLEAAGLLIVWLTDRICRAVWPGGACGGLPGTTLLAGGAVFMIAWTELAAAFAHLDDGMALLLATLAVYAAVAGHPVACGLCVGLAADAKPWALVFLPVVLIAGRADERRRGDSQPVLIALTTALATTAAGYLPFFLADPGTVHATRFLIRNQPMSALRALGVTDGYTPSWDRPAQILLGWTLGTLAAARGRWPAILLLAGGARIMLDPAAHSYYTPDVMTGALLWDMLGGQVTWPRHTLPLCTLISFAALNLTPHLIASPAGQGAIRLGLVLACTAAVLALPGARHGQVMGSYTTGSPPRQTRRGSSP